VEFVEVRQGALGHVTSFIEHRQRICLPVYAVHMCVGKQWYCVTAALLHAPDWAMFKPRMTGSGELEAQEADHVEWPNEDKWRARGA